SLLGGLALFLFGMNLMGEALERRAGSKLELMLSKLTGNQFFGFLTGLAVTSVIQSSSATTVMVVGFVNSGLMTLKQAIGVIMGANIGTTVTAWILSLAGIEGGNIFLDLLKPTSFTPILAVIGIVMYMGKDPKRKDIGVIFLGFATLMFGMDTMSGAVSGLKGEAWFTNLFTYFTNPILGVLAGAILTAIIQSSSASVGILQSLSQTGAITYRAAIPIIMGQNIGTCITAILSSFGTNKNAKRAAMVHLCFNIIGTVVWLAAFTVVDATLEIAIFGDAANQAGIAVCHSIFNVLSTLLLFPMAGLLEKLAYKLVPETKVPDTVEELDERLLATPAVALERCHTLSLDMAKQSVSAMADALSCLDNYSEELAASVREREDKADHYEDIVGSYLVKLSAQRISEEASADAAKYLKIIGDFERISDHAVNVLKSAEELREKGLAFSGDAEQEIKTLREAITEILDMSLIAFENDDVTAAERVEPLEQVIDRMKRIMRSNHIKRLQLGNCSIDVGFVWNDLLTNLERVSDHCSNVAGHVIDARENNMNIHESLRAAKSDSPFFKEQYEQYAEKYLIPKA
ncbi:MAG: Na/Pi cotransporter family protein, partial [Clostridia bacterium]|nr:Na/Pi cotransporter family protein [Clostridia bacterium]